MKVVSCCCCGCKLLFYVFIEYAPRIVATSEKKKKIENEIQ